MTKALSKDAGQALDNIKELHNQASSLASAYGEDRDLVNQLLGQAQMADAIAKFSRTIGISKLAHIKENKLYKAISGQKNPNGSENLRGTWAEFCELLGISVDKADIDISNLHAFGEEALECMTQMGIGYREMRQFRRLPEDQKTALIEVAKTEDKDSFIELAEEIITKHSKEKEQLTAERDEAIQDKEALEHVLQDKVSKLGEMERELSKKQLSPVPPDEEAEELRKQAALIGYQAEHHLRVSVLEAFKQVMDHGEANNIDTSAWLHGQLQQITESLTYLTEQLGMASWLDDSDVLSHVSEGEETPLWLMDNTAKGEKNEQ